MVDDDCGPGRAEHCFRDELDWDKRNTRRGIVILSSDQQQDNSRVFVLVTVELLVSDYISLLLQQPRHSGAKLLTTSRRCSEHSF